MEAKTKKSSAKAPKSPSILKVCHLYGYRELAVVANRDIAYGEVVDYEARPIMLFRGNESREPVEMVKAALNAHPSWTEPQRFLIESNFADMGGRWCNTKNIKPFEGLPQELQQPEKRRGVINLLLKEVPECKQSIMLLTLLHHFCVPLTMSFVPMKEYLYGIYRRLSWYNHSCAPNCIVSYDDATGEARVITQVNVKRGSELTVGYTHIMECFPVKFRSDVMHKMMGFQCVCYHCRWTREMHVEQDIRHGMFEDDDTRNAIVNACIAIEEGLDPRSGIELLTSWSRKQLVTADGYEAISMERGLDIFQQVILTAPIVARAVLMMPCDEASDQFLLSDDVLAWLYKWDFSIQKRLEEKKHERQPPLMDTLILLAAYFLYHFVLFPMYATEDRPKLMRAVHEAGSNTLATRQLQYLYRIKNLMPMHLLNEEERSPQLVRVRMAMNAIASDNKS